METQVGTHTMSIDGDILFLKAIGDLLEEDTQTYIMLANQIIAAHDAFFVLNNFSDLGTIGPVARKQVAGWISQVPCRGAAIYGASLSARTLAILIIGAMKVLGSKTVPLIFVKTERDARLWIAAQRQKRLAK